MPTKARSESIDNPEVAESARLVGAVAAARELGVPLPAVPLPPRDGPEALAREERARIIGRARRAVELAVARVTGALEAGGAGAGGLSVAKAAELALSGPMLKAIGLGEGGGVAEGTVLGVVLSVRLAPEPLVAEALTPTTSAEPAEPPGPLAPPAPLPSSPPPPSPPLLLPPSSSSLLE